MDKREEKKRRRTKHTTRERLRVFKKLKGRARDGEKWGKTNQREIERKGSKAQSILRDINHTHAHIKVRDDDDEPEQGNQKRQSERKT